MTEEGLSLRPSDAVETGVTPTDCNMEVKDAEFTIWDYMGKGQSTTALRVALVDDEGGEYEQYYSVGPPDKFVPSGDGKKVLPATSAIKGISKTCNYMDFSKGLISAGFPENRLGEDISILVGLYAHWVGQPQRERKGIPGGTMPLPVPDKILRLPWDKGGKVARPKAAATAAAPGANSNKLVELAELAQAVVGDRGTITLKNLASEVYTQKDGDSDMLDFVFSDELKVELLSVGLKVSGQEISKA